MILKRLRTEFTAVEIGKPDVKRELVRYQTDRSSSIPNILLREDLWVLLSYGLFIIYLLLILLTFLDYGITYDEEWHSTYGEYIVQWFTSGFQDTRALTYWTLPLQGGFISVIDSLLSRISPWGVFETNHLVNGIFGLFGIIGAYKLGRLLGGSFAGFLSALFLFLTPRFYGHAFNNTIDIPFASLSIFALYFLIVSIPHFPRVPWVSLIQLGVVMGLALAVRTAAVLLVGYIVLTYVFWFMRQYFTRGVNEETNWRRVIAGLALDFFVICAISYFVMLLFWPAAQVRPIIQPAKGLLYTTRFQYTFDVFFDGKFIPNDALPWYFLPKWFAITLPEYYFIALVVGLIVVGVGYKKLASEFRNTRFDEFLGFLILILSIILPLVLTIFTRPANYDALRHFLFVIPPLAVLAGTSIAKLVRRPASRPVYGVILAGILASLAITCVDMWQLHPYQYIYFNHLFGGGLAKASKYYETEYWGSSYKEGVEWLVSNYQVPESQERPKVASCLYSLSTSYYLPEDRFEYLGSFQDGNRIASDAKPDLFLASPRWDCHKKLGGKILHTICRQGAPLLYVIEVSGD